MTKNHNKGNKIILIFLVILVIAIVSHPQIAYESAMRGLGLWWEIVTPALLPFFFLSELLMGMNVTHYLGKAMSPLMRPLFALPGSAALAVALGFCSGFPSGAAITASLRRNNEISREEGERLICFTNNAGPLYISVAVAGGLLHCPKAAAILAITHYGGNLLIGIIMGLFSRRKGAAAKREDRDLLMSKLPQQEDVSIKDFGGMLKAAVTRAAANIATIGCLMTFFAVTTGLIMTLELPDITLVQAFIQGFWEMSLGVNALADSELAMAQIIPAAAAVLGFGGISVQMQVLAMVGDTDIRIFPYLTSRIVHAIISFVIAGLLCSFVALPAAGIAFIPPQINMLGYSLQLFAMAMGGLVAISLLSLGLQRLYRPLRRS